MPAAVMYRRWVFDKFLFDVSAPDSCGDYDLNLRVACNCSVIHHTKKVASYRIHTSNMSSNIPLMLTSVLQVLKRQEVRLKTNHERTAFIEGLSIWKDYYCKELYRKLKLGKVTISYASVYTLLRYKPKLMLKYLINWR
jgi:hypothetical protein